MTSSRVNSVRRLPDIKEEPRLATTIGIPSIVKLLKIFSLASRQLCVNACNCQGSMRFPSFSNLALTV